MHIKIRNIVLVALFISMEIILTRFLSVESPIVRISFEFIPIALSAVLFGPVVAGGAAAAADVLGMLIFPKGAYFAGFTFSAFVSGFVYGLFLYKKKITLLRTFLAALAVVVTSSLLLNSLWLIFFFGNGAYAVISARLLKAAIFIPVETVMIYFLLRLSQVGKIVGNMVNNKA